MSKFHILNYDKNLSNLIHFIKFNLTFNKSLLSKDNNIKIFTSGTENYDSLFEDITNARQSIYIEYFAIHNDRIGKKFRNLLAIKAREGIEVRLLYDGLVNYKTPKSFFNELIAYGGHVINYKRIFLGASFRNHRKIVVIDDHIGYIGGMNIGEKYCNMHRYKVPWRDTQIRIIGSSVLDLKYYFICDWNLFASKYKLIKNIDFLKNYNIEPKDKDSFYENDCVQIIAGGCNNLKCNTEFSYSKILNTAKSRIYIQTPYVIPGNTVLKDLTSLSSTGIDVCLMIPLLNSGFVIKHISNYYISKLVKKGVKIYRYTGYIHAKTILVDDCLTCIGSVNLDERSLIINDEIFSCIYSKNFNNKYFNIFLDDLTHCKELNYDDFKSRGTFTKILEYILAFFSPLF